MSCGFDRIADVVAEPDEDLLAEIAIERGMVSPDAMRECREEQARANEPFLAPLLLRRGALTPRQLADLLRECERRDGSPLAGGRQGHFLGLILAADGVLAPEALRLALRRQRETARSAPRRLAELLIEARAVTLPQIRDRLRCFGCGERFPSNEWQPDQEIFCPKCASEGIPGDPRDATGAPFGRYRLLEQIAQGGSGIVWKAWDPRLRVIVALKQIPPEHPDLRNPAELSRVRHPAILPIRDAGFHEESFFLVRDWVPGETFDRWRMGRPREVVLGVLKTVAEALHEAHRAGVVHGDLKPSNILLDDEGHPFLPDWEGGGTPAYMSPEQAERGERTPRGDQFSLGVILYEALTNRLPFEGTTLRQILDRVAKSEPVPPGWIEPDLPRDLEAVCLRALARRPSDRYPSMGALAEDLGRVLRHEPLRPSRRPGRILAAALAGLAAVAVITAWPGRGGRNLVEEGVRLEAAGRYEDARSAFQAALRIAPSGEAEAGLRRVAHALERRAESDRRRQATAGALRLLEEARPLLDRAVRLVNSAGPNAEASACSEQALGKILEALRIAPDLAPSHYLLGIARQLQGREDEAEACWIRTLEIDPSFAAARYRLGRLLLDRSFDAMAIAGGRGERSAREKTEAISERAAEYLTAACSGLDTEMERTLAQGIAAFARDDREGAVRIAREGLARFGEAEGVEEFYWLLAMSSPADRKKALDRAIALRPAYAQALFIRALIRQMEGDLVRAIEDYSAAIRIRPRHVPSWINRGNSHLARGEPAEAISDYTAAVGLDPTLAAAYTNRAQALLRLGKPEAAIADLDRALSIDPDQPEAHILRGEIKFQRGDVRGASEDYSRAIECDPKFAAGYARRAVARERMGDAEGALRDYDEALRLNPRQALVRMNRGVLRSRLGDTQGAKRDWDLAIRTDPRCAEAYANRGDLRRREGDLEGAIADYEAALRLAPPGSQWVRLVRHNLELLRRKEKEY